MKKSRKMDKLISMCLMCAHTIPKLWDNKHFIWICFGYKYLFYIIRFDEDIRRQKKTEFFVKFTTLLKIYAVNYVRKFYHVFYCVIFSFFGPKSHVLQKVRRFFFCRSFWAIITIDCKLRTHFTHKTIFKKFSHMRHIISHIKF